MRRARPQQDATQAVRRAQIAHPAPPAFTVTDTHGWKPQGRAQRSVDILFFHPRPVECQLWLPLLHPPSPYYYVPHPRPQTPDLKPQILNA